MNKFKCILVSGPSMEMVSEVSRLLLRMVNEIEEIVSIVAFVKHKHFQFFVITLSNN